MAAYFGESGQNGYTRGTEHFEKKLAKDEDNSVLWLHCLHHNQGREGVGVERMQYRTEDGEVFQDEGLSPLFFNNTIREVEIRPVELGWTHFYLRFSRAGQVGVFGSAIDPPGPKKSPSCSILAPWAAKNGRNRPIWAIGGKKRIDGCDDTEISVVKPLGIIRIDE